MRYLLDTHVVLWMLDEDNKFSEKAVRILRDPASKKYVSIASAWEVAIKVGTGKLHLDGEVSEFFKAIHQSDFGLLPIKTKHVKQLATLPLLHRDPFDRILIASAIAEGMGLITADTNIRLYDVRCLW